MLDAETGAGLLTERHVVECAIGHLVAQMAREERVERLRQLRNKARLEYLPQYEAALKTIDGAARHVDEEHG